MLDFAWGGHLWTQASWHWIFHAEVCILRPLFKAKRIMRASHQPALDVYLFTSGLRTSDMTN